MLQFIFRKMLSKKWMVLALLTGNILLISIASSNPMYTQAMLQRTLNKNFETALMETNAYPGLVTLEVRRGITSGNTKERGIVQRGDALAAEIPGRFGLDAVESLRQTVVATTLAVTDVPREDTEELRLSLSMLSDLDQHVEMVGGELYAPEPDADGVIDAIVSEAGLANMKLVVGDVLTLPKMLDAEGNPLRIRISGVFRNRSEDDVYWVNAPSFYRKHCFIDPALFQSLFLSKEELDYFVESTWHVLLDYTAMRADRADDLLAIAQGCADQFGKGAELTYRDRFTGLLTDFQKSAKKVSTTLWVLQVPIFILLAAFIFMVSRQMVDMERDEIAVIKSRGAGRGQIFGMYLLQSLLISLIALAVGLPLGMALCQVIGASNAFLEFVRRRTLTVELNAGTMVCVAVASLFSIGAMVLPAARYSRASIVNQKRRKHKHSETPLWQKLGLDFLLLAVALYGLYSFNGQKDILAARVQDGASLDPLLFLCSSLFMLGAGLLAVRLMPLIVWIVYRPFRRLWSPALYASFLRVLRARSSHGFIMVFLIMTIALGIFDAQTARSINQNMEDNLRYAVGADVVLQERWADNSYILMEDPNAEVTYTEPDFGRFEALEGAASVAKVYVNDNIELRTDNGRLKNVRLMAIHTKSFGETAWFKDSLSDIHWYHYLNAMSKNSRAVLVSRNLQANYGFKLGDSISYESPEGDMLRGVIYGFVDYFPGFAPVSYARGEDGLYKETENTLIVANLQQVQTTWGVKPYQVWIRNRDSAAYLYDFAEREELRLTQFQDADARLVEKKNDPVLQGTNGFLTVGFIVVLLLCSVGFLIYWILSIRSRSLQFGIFRAMGMSMREVLVMLLNEQLYISGLSIATGALVGHLTAKLYMPLIQIAYAASDNALPLEIISLPSDSARLFAVIGAVMLVCMVILGGLIARMKIAQALKLGED